MVMILYMRIADSILDDLQRGLDAIQNITNKKIDCYRAPGFSITEKTKWYVDELVSQGIKYDSSIFPATRGHGGFPSFEDAGPSIIERNGFKLKEFPINSAKFLGYKYIFSGGGYFRLFPEWLLKHHFNNNKYTMTYFHLRDFDKDQPKLDMNKLRKFKSYYGISGSWKKYLNILEAFNFIDLKIVDTQTDWSKCKVYNFND